MTGWDLQLEKLRRMSVSQKREQRCYQNAMERIDTFISFSGTKRLHLLPWKLKKKSFEASQVWKFLTGSGSAEKLSNVGTMALVDL